MKNRFNLPDSLIDAVKSVIEGNKKLDPVGKADADIDNDGDVDKSDSYLHNRRKAIKKAMKKEEVEQTEEVKKTAPFSKPYKKVGDRKDEYGNVVKNAAKYLAKKAMKKQMNKEEFEQVDELSKNTLKSYLDKNPAVDGYPEGSTKRKIGAAQAIGRIKHGKMLTKTKIGTYAPKKYNAEDIEQTDESAMSRMDVQTKEKERLDSDKVKGSGLKTFKKKDEVDVKPKMAEATELPKKVIMKGHEIAKKLIKMKSKVDNPYAVGMATAKKKYNID